jgi:hypothetical protein
MKLILPLAESLEAASSTNLLARFPGLHAKAPNRPTAGQVESYLTANGRSAASLLAAYRTTGDAALLAEATQKYGNDPQVALDLGRRCRNGSGEDGLSQLVGTASEARALFAINCATDHDLVRRLFVVPGDDPDRIATSYEVIRSDKDALVLRTPVLPNGKRLAATYRVEEDQGNKARGQKHRQVWVKSTIREVE